MDETTALDAGGQINYFQIKTAGILYNKFCQGILMDFVWGRAFIYAFFQLYLNLPGHQYNAVMSMIQILWALKIVWGIATDALPICGKRRLPYMILGWSGALVAFIFCAFMKKPEPYYTVDGCNLNKTLINNPSNVETAVPYIYAIAAATCMLSIADMASDALVIEYNRREPINIRGQSTTYATISESAGHIATILIIGLLLNGPSYGGVFCWEIPISSYFIYLAVVCIGGICSASFFTIEHCKVKYFSWQFLEKYIKDFWSIIAEKEFVRFSFFLYFYYIIISVQSSAAVKVKSKWAKVDPTANTISNLLARVLLSLGMYIYKCYFINTSWRKILCFTNIFILIVSILIDSITIFDWLRNPYFYISEALLVQFSWGLMIVLTIQVCGEMTESTFEGITFGMYMAVWSSTSPISLVIGNIVSAEFDVSEDDRYLRDSDDDRWAVFLSILTCKFINFCGLILIYTLLTDQKKKMQENLRLGQKCPLLRNIFVFIFASSLLWIIVTNILALHPSTSCYFLVGGKGC